MMIKQKFNVACGTSSISRLSKGLMSFAISQLLRTFSNYRAGVDKFKGSYSLTIKLQEFVQQLEKSTTIYSLNGL